MAKKKKNLNVESVDDSNSEALTAEEISKKYTVAELRAILKENGLSTSGKKKDLVERVLPILNDDSSEASSEDGEAEKVDLSSQVTEEPITSALSGFGINYDELDIKDKISEGDDTSLNIEGFTQNGLSMSDSTLSIVAASDSSNVDLKMNIPEVSYTNFENTIFTFKDLELSILPSSDPQTLEFSAVMDSLEIITESNYVNLKGLNLNFKSFPDRGVCLDIGIDSFIFPDFDDTSITFEDLCLNISLGLDGEMLGISTKLPKLSSLTMEVKVILSSTCKSTPIASTVIFVGIIGGRSRTAKDAVAVDSA